MNAAFVSRLYMLSVDRIVDGAALDIETRIDVLRDMLRDELSHHVGAHSPAALRSAIARLEGAMAALEAIPRPLEMACVDLNDNPATGGH